MQDDDDELDTGGKGNADHVVSQLADLLAETGQLTRQQALHYLMHTARGAAILARVRNRKVFAMNRTDQLCAIVKRAGGVHGLAKRIVKDGSSGGVSEAEWTGMLTAVAQAQYPHLTSEAAFSKLFCDPSSAVLRQASQIAMFSDWYGR